MFIQKIDDEISLMLLEKRHAAEVFKLMEESRAHLRKYLFFVDETQKPEDTEAFIVESLHKFAHGEAYQCGIVRDGEIKGLIGLTSIDLRTKSAEVGYWLAENNQGKGYVTRAVAGMLDFAFGELGLNRIVLRAVTENRASNAVARRLDFEQEGVLREAEKLEDGFYDFNLYSLLKKDWQRAD